MAYSSDEVEKKKNYLLHKNSPIVDCEYVLCLVLGAKALPTKLCKVTCDNIQPRPKAKTHKENVGSGTDTLKTVDKLIRKLS